MLDIHAINGVPGAALTLGNAFSVVAPGGDGAANAGVPIKPGAVLRGWGALSIPANTIAHVKMSSLDMFDPVNGEDYITGVASLLNLFLAYDRLKFEKAARFVYMGTNTGTAGATAWTMDEYSEGPVIADADNVVVCPATTFGSASVLGTWNSQPFTPAVALPAGSYAIMGALVSGISYGGLLRFNHTDFLGFAPGFPVVNYEIISTSSWDKIYPDDLLNGQTGWQFLALSKSIGRPQCPVFRSTSAGTGLVLQYLAQATDTPVVSLVLAKVG